MKQILQEERQSWVQTYYASFEGLRGLAILAVVFCHYGPLLWNSQLTAWWWVGVDIFFVLSGFLITGNLFDSLHSKTYYKSFYQRRALRIFPLYYGLLFLIYLCTFLSPHVRVRGAFALNLVYLSNLAVPFLDWNRENPTIVDFFFHQMRTHLEAALGVFWTLCIEEQFYLIWPLIMRHLATRERVLRFCGVAIALVPLLRLVLFYTVPPSVLAKHLLYEATYTRCDELLMGAWGAVWLRGVRLSRSELRKGAYVTGVLSSASLGLGLALTRGSRTDDFNHITQGFVSTLGFTLIGLLALATLLLSLDGTHPLTKVLCWKPLQQLGRVSYGVYVFHMIPFSLFAYYLDRGLRQNHLAAAALVGLMVLVYGTAWASFHCFEAPIMRLGKQHLFSRGTRKASAESSGLVLAFSATTVRTSQRHAAKLPFSEGDPENLHLVHRPTGT